MRLGASLPALLGGVSPPGAKSDDFRHAPPPRRCDGHSGAGAALRQGDGDLAVLRLVCQSFSPPSARAPCRPAPAGPRPSLRLLRASTPPTNGAASAHGVHATWIIGTIPAPDATEVIRDMHLHEIEDGAAASASSGPLPWREQIHE